MFYAFAPALFVILQIANAIAFVAVAADWLGLHPTNIIGYIAAAIAVGCFWLFYSFIPFSTLISAVAIFYYLYFVWDWNLIVSLLVAFPALFIFITAAFMARSEERNRYP